MSSTSNLRNANTSDLSERLAMPIEWLRAEQESANSALRRAVLLHEIAIAETASGNEGSAARSELLAINEEPDFAEPLEHLIALVERRGSFRNLAKLLERLVELAAPGEERTRALIKRAAFLVDFENDIPAAIDLLEQALEAAPEDAGAWLALEFAAGKLGDETRRLRALAARAALAEPPTWRALLLIDLARLHLSLGDAEAAFAALDQALANPGQAAYATLLAREELARREERHDLLAATLESQARALEAALADSAVGDAQGVPRFRRTEAHVVDTWLRAAEARRQQGDLATAASELSGALERLGPEPALLHARLRLAELAGDTTLTANLARAEIGAGSSGSAAAAAWLRVAEAAASEGNAPEALAAVEQALRADPGSLPARTLKLDLLSGGHDPQALAAILENTAEQLPTDAGKARSYLLAADVWGRGCRDVDNAKTALSQAGMSGTPPRVLARVARLLSALIGDQLWYEEATRRLIATTPSGPEQSDLWFELGRAKLLRGDLTGANVAFEALSGGAGNTWLGRALRAYVTLAEDGSPSSSLRALEELVQGEADPELARALGAALARRRLAAGDRGGAVRDLEPLHQADPSDPTIAVALAALLQHDGERVRAAQLLENCAGLLEPSELTAALQVQAGALWWGSGDRLAAVESFATAATVTDSAASVLHAWALRGAQPDDVAARRKALTVAASFTEQDCVQLDRFALEVGAEGDPIDARTALSELAPSPHPELAATAVLAQALWQASDELATIALEELADWGPTAQRVARASQYQWLLEEQTDAEATEQAAHTWLEADPGDLVAALEWLGSTVRADHVGHEIAARRHLAGVLGGELAPLLRGSASMVALLHGLPAAPEPDADSEAVRLMNVELALPGTDPSRRAEALEGLGAALGEESQVLAQALAGWNQLGAGDSARAMESFRRVLEHSPEEVMAWEGLRAAAEARGDQPVLAEACAALGDAVSDASLGSEYWERAATILLDRLGDAARGEYALARAVERDVRRGTAFDRLFRIVRARKDGDRLLELIEARLDATDQPEELAKLYWERARVLREAGDREGALRALDDVTLLEPDHVGALALKGEIYIGTGEFADAAESLARLAELQEAPTKQRLMSGVAAADLYENKLGAHEEALEVLVQLYRAGLSTLPVRERLARLSAKLESWDHATEVLEKLMHERETREARMEAARLSLAIHRDRRGQPAAAQAAVRRLLSEAPEDGEAIDLVLTGVLPSADARKLLLRSREAVVAKLVADPFDAPMVSRLANMARFLDDAPLRQASLGVLVALGAGSKEVDHELQQLDERVARLPQHSLTETAVPELCDPQDGGPLAELMRAMASTFAEAFGPSREGLGVGKRERVDPRSGMPLRNEIAAWVGALGIGDWELYVGGNDPNGVTAVATELPALVVGSNVQAPLAPMHRQLVARELFALRRGTTLLRHRDPSDIAALVVATCRLAGSEVAAPPYAMLNEFQRQLGKVAPRRVRKLLPEWVQPLLTRRFDTLAWVRAATASLDRMAALAAGDVSCVLSPTPAERGKLGSSAEARERARRILSFVLSPSYLKLRSQLGMGVR